MTLGFYGLVPLKQAKLIAKEASSAVCDVGMFRKTSETFFAAAYFHKFFT